MDTTGHQIIACALGRALGEHGSFNIYKTMCIKVLAHFRRDAVAQHQIVLHVRAAQIKHAMRQTGGFRQIVLIHLKGRCDRGVEYRQFMAQHFNVAAFQMVIDRSRRAYTHQACDLNTKLVTQMHGCLESLGAIGITHNLHITLAVTNIDKNHTTMVSPPIDPATQSDPLAYQGFGNQTTIMGTHNHINRFQ